MGRSYKEYNKKFVGKFTNEFLAKTRVVCKCGHTVNFISRADVITCSHCGRLIFKNKKAEFDYRTKKVRCN